MRMEAKNLRCSKALVRGLFCCPLALRSLIKIAASARLLGAISYCFCRNVELLCLQFAPQLQHFLNQVGRQGGQLRVGIEHAL